MKIRATSRLLGASVTTMGMLGELMLRQQFAPSRADQLTRSYKRSWARRLMRQIGLEVQVESPPPANARGLLVVANHRSYLDIPVMMTQIDCAILSKAEVAKWPVFGVAARSVGTLFVDRSNAASRAATLEAVGHRLQEGETVLAFPEGTTYPSPEVGEFKPGLFLLAAKMGVPVLPAALHYAEPRLEWVGEDDFMSHFMRNFQHKGGRVRLSFGETLQNADGRELCREAENWVRERVSALTQAAPPQETR